MTAIREIDFSARAMCSRDDLEAREGERALRRILAAAGGLVPIRTKGASRLAWVNPDSQETAPATALPPPSAPPADILPVLIDWAIHSARAFAWYAQASDDPAFVALCRATAMSLADDAEHYQDLLAAALAAPEPAGRIPPDQQPSGTALPIRPLDGIGGPAPSSSGGGDAA